MAKRNSTRRKAQKTKFVTPLTEIAAATARAEPPRDFHAIKEDIYDYLNLVECAWHALNESEVVDGDKAASQARNGIHLCAQKLDLLMDEMEIWEMTAGGGQRRAKLRQEVSHG